MCDLSQQIKASINLLELVKEYCEVKPVGTNVWAAHCPHPDHNDRTASFRIWYNETTKNWSWACMGCHNGKKDLNSRYKNYGTDCFAFLQWMSDYKGSKHVLTFPEAIKVLASKLNLSIPAFSNKNIAIIKRLNRNSICYQSNLTTQIKQYLCYRGLDKQDLQQWKIGACDWHYGYRIMFPLFNRDKNVIGFSGRLWNWSKDSIQPKYYNSKCSEVFRKSSYFYGEHLITDEYSDVIITEGVFDVILSHKYKVQNVIATLGTSFTQEHVDKIKKYNKTPIFCLDADNAGQKATLKAISLLAQSGIYSKVCILPTGYDLADLANKEKCNLKEYIRLHTILYWQYILKDTTLYFESKLNELRMEILPSILKVKDSVQTVQEQIMFNNFLIERFGINKVI